MDDTENTFERIKSFLYKSESDELILLKGHLLIEEVFDLIIRFALSKNVADKLQLNFYRKLLLVCGLTNYKLDSDLVNQITHINRIRNDFAHDLETNIKTDLINFVQSVHGGRI